MKQFDIGMDALILLLAFIAPALAEERDSSAHPPEVDVREAEGQAALKRTFDELLPKAESGDPTAQYRVGKHFDFGWGVEQDGWKAVMCDVTLSRSFLVQVALANLYAGAYYGYLRNEENRFESKPKDRKGSWHNDSQIDSLASRSDHSTKSGEAIYGACRQTSINCCPTGLGVARPRVRADWLAASLWCRLSSRRLNFDGGASGETRRNDEVVESRCRR